MTAGLSRGEKVRMVVAFVLGGLALVFGSALLFGAVSDREALLRSLTREARSPFEVECSRGAGGFSRCLVADRAGSGSASYRFKERGDCWSARRTSPQHFTEGPMPGRLEGCVTFRDRYPFFDSLLEVRELL
jgi:hypothetical protein